MRCRAHAIEKPGNEAELVALVRRAADEGRTLRAVGTGHSSMPLVATDGIIASLEALSGVEQCDRETLRATVRGGSVIRDLGPPLLEHDLALENQGDIDVQSIAGAIGTGTHGTGRALGNLSTHVVGLRVVTATGEVACYDAVETPELFLAARVSLGTLGVVSAVRLRLVPAYRLHERVWRVPIDECLADLERHIAENRHFEFFWFPSLDAAEMKTLNPTDAEPDDLPDTPGQRIGWSCYIISSVRELKFHEMEYSIPAEAGPECFREVRERMREKHPDVVWPVEYRSLAADDAWLSTAYERETVTISIHQDYRLEFREMFRDLESIFRAHRGRPHWGKVHTRTAAELATLYPRWERFCAVRRRLDPDGLFLNDYLRGLFEL